MAASEYQIHYSNQVNQLLKQINPNEMWKNLTFITSYHDRSANLKEGELAANWIKEQIIEMTKRSNRQDVSIFTIDTHYDDDYEYKQPSVVAKIGSSNEPGIVIGAHIDVAGCQPWKGHEDCSSDYAGYPGADDDGSGIVTLMETARILLANNVHLTKPIYIIWYADEEGGDIGSQQVVQYFKKKYIPVAAVMQLDQTGYAYKNDQTMWLFNDSGLDKSLTKFLHTLVSTYINVPVKYTSGSSSDDDSWTSENYKVARPAEGDYTGKEGQPNPFTHKPDDTMDKLSLDHMTNYLKLTIAFVVELGEPQS